MTHQEREDDAAKCRSRMSTAQRARAFLDGEFWERDLRPLMEKEQEDAKLQCLWAPSSCIRDGASVDQVAMKVAYASGASASIERILIKIREMVKLGEEAEQDLKRLEGKE